MSTIVIVDDNLITKFRLPVSERRLRPFSEEDLILTARVGDLWLLRRVIGSHINDIDDKTLVLIANHLPPACLPEYRAILHSFPTLRRNRLVVMTEHQDAESATFHDRGWGIVESFVRKTYPELRIVEILDLTLIDGELSSWDEVEAHHPMYSSIVRWMPNLFMVCGEAWIKTIVRREHNVLPTSVFNGKFVDIPQGCDREPEFTLIQQPTYRNDHRGVLDWLEEFCG